MGNIIRELKKAGIWNATAITLDEVAKEVHNPFMDNDDPAAGAGTKAIILEVRDFRGDKVNYAVRLALIVYQDDGSGNMKPVPSATANLATATKGKFVNGEGTNITDIETDTNGEFACTLTNSADDTVWLVAEQSAGSPVIDSTGIDSVTFTP